MDMKTKIVLVLSLLFFGHSVAMGDIRIACIGDSITYGLGIEDRSATYPSQLQVLLGDGYEVRNFGSSGRGVIKSSKRGKGWRAYIKQDEHQQALAFEPDVVICNLGINDMDAYRSGHAAEFAPDYLELLRAYRELPSNPKIFIWTKLAPLYPANKCHEWDTAFVLRLDLEKVAAESGAVGLDLFSPLVNRPDLFRSDGIHPNEKGYEVIAQEMMEAIEPYLNGDFGDLKLPYVYSDHMVLQRGKELCFQGTANAGQSVRVRFAGKTGEAITGRDGRWEMRLPPMEAGGPYVLEFQTLEKTVRFEDVMLGEVWIAAGQSNMEFPLASCWGGQKEVAEANDPNLRLLDRQRTVPKGKSAWSEDELENCTLKRFYKGTWDVCSPEATDGFSGVAYFFAKQLRQELGVPVGIIHVAIGGAPIEAFIREGAMLANPLLLPEVVGNDYWFNNENYPDWVRGRAKGQLYNWIAHPTGSLPEHPFAPAFLYRATIQPLGQFPIRGVIWYQGESNAARLDGTPYPYGLVHAGLETLVTDWRRQFEQGDFPFLYVQLPNYTRNWMLFRQMQLDVSKELPNIGMAVTIDVGDPKTIHPRNKRPVGDRLASLALAKGYGKAVAYSGPAYRDFTVEGSRVRVVFGFAEGLHPASVTGVVGFEVTGEDGVYHQAHATIENDAVILHSPDVPSPVAIRYGWKGNPDCNLVNSAQLPASPFRATAFSR